MVVSELKSEMRLALFSLVGLALLAGSASAQVTAVDELVARNLQARGGAEKLRAVESVRMTGKIRAQGGVVPMTTWVKRPNKVRRENINEGQTFVVAFDGKTAWTINPMISPLPREIKGPQAEMTAQDADDFDTVLLDYKTKGHTVELVGPESVAGIATQHLRVTKKDGRVQDIFLNAETGLEMRTSMTVEQAGRKAVVSTDFSNYKAIGGITMPFSIRQSFDGKPVAEVTYEQIQFNLPLDDALFSMPVK